MILRTALDISDAKKQQIHHAKRLEWITIFFMLTIILVMFITMGSSQAMKAAWVEDILGLVPPTAFLIAMRVQGKSPNERFPYGYQRAVSIAFLVASTALFMLGAYILFDSVMALIMQEHPTIGIMRVFGYDFWAGWAMIAALVYSAIPPVILGRLKLPISKEIHDKTLHTDAVMNKADWMTAVAGVFGIVGIGMGWWWADSVAAGIISFDIVKDGATNLKAVVEDLMDRHPQTVERKEPDEVLSHVSDALKALDWVRDADVRLREEGQALNGELFVVPVDKHDLIARLREAQKTARSVNWRVHDVVALPVERLDDTGDTSRRNEQS